MTRIRKLNCFDYPKLKKMISYLGSPEGEFFTKALINEPFGIISSILPLKFKFLHESYILLDGKEILGLITIEPSIGNPYKINITRLVFQNNLYDAGKQLIFTSDRTPGEIPDLEERLRNRSHAVIVAAEGAGQGVEEREQEVHRSIPPKGGFRLGRETRKNSGGTERPAVFAILEGGRKDQAMGS